MELAALCFEFLVKQVALALVELVRLPQLLNELLELVLLQLQAPYHPMELTWVFNLLCLGLS